MCRFRFELASEADDVDLRRVLAETPMKGNIAVAFRREPSWFAAAAIDGHQRQVVACRDVKSGRIVGFGCRSIRTLFVDGQPRSVGYLSSLRLLADYRNRGLVARGYAYIRNLHSDGLAPYYLTTIAAGNDVALAVLTSGRASLPAYVSAGNYHTLAIPLRQARANGFATSLAIRPATTDDLGALLEFIADEGPHRQFFPVVDPHDFTGRPGQFLGLALDDILLAWRGAEIVGMLGAWDQHSYKQSMVMGYHGSLRWLRPALNMWWSLRGEPCLPSPGGLLRFRVAALPLTKGDSHEVMQALLAATSHRWAGRPESHLLLGLHERDPLLPAARRWSAACYTTHSYLVAWGQPEELLALAHRRVPYLELGTL